MIIIDMARVVFCSVHEISPFDLSDDAIKKPETYTSCA